MGPWIHDRHDVREKALGAILWSYMEEPGSPCSQGGLEDLSTSGIGLRTHTPLKQGDLLRVNLGIPGTSERVARVQWVRKVAPAVYRSGLRFTSVAGTSLS